MSANSLAWESPRIVDAAKRRAAVQALRERGIRLPTFGQLANPRIIPQETLESLADVDPDSPRAENLWRIHWHNDWDRRRMVETPRYLVIPESLSGVPTKILVLIGANFPMIGAHKVLPAYAGLVARLVTGQFDPNRDKAIWPSTGNYCRGGVAISRILGCHGVAILPEGMSRERFEWLERWTSSPLDIVRTPGTESNVKEIYDETNRLAQSAENVIFNQFSAFSNYMAHRRCTGAAAALAFQHLQANAPDLRLSAFVSATGSAGTIAAGDRLKAEFGAKIVAVESLECPTMLRNGYGEHNIQGIGDKHIPLIHNVMNTDFVVDVPDSVTDRLNLLFGCDLGRSYLLARKGVDRKLMDRIGEIGISGIANIVAAIKLAKYLDYDERDVVVTVATDGAAMYASERAEVLAHKYRGSFDEVDAAEIFGSCLAATTTDNMLELTHPDRQRIFNLGYYTWVEQQGVSLQDFDRRREQKFWDDIYRQSDNWDELIDSFNVEAETG